MSTRKAPLSYGAESLGKGGQRFYSKDWTSLYTIALDINGHDRQYLLGQYMYTLTGRMSHCQFKIFDSSTWTFWILLVSDPRNSWSSCNKNMNKSVTSYTVHNVLGCNTIHPVTQKMRVKSWVLTHPRSSELKDLLLKNTHTPLLFPFHYILNTFSSYLNFQCNSLRMKDIKNYVLGASWSPPD